MEFNYLQIGSFSFTPLATLSASQVPKAELYSRTEAKEWSDPVTASILSLCPAFGDGVSRCEPELSAGCSIGGVAYQRNDRV